MESLRFVTFIIIFTLIDMSHGIAYNKTENLDLNGKFKIWWGYDNANIQFKVKVETTGWIGIGFSADGDMPRSDMVIGWFRDNKTNFADRHAIITGMPIVDTVNNYNLIKMTEANGFTTMEFTRKIRLCNSQDFDITATKMQMMYAYHIMDPTSENNILQHSNRGHKVVKLFADGAVTENTCTAPPPKTTKAPLTTEQPTTTKVPTNTDIPTNTSASTTTNAPKTTEAPTTTEALTTTKAPTTTKIATTTGIVKGTENGGTIHRISMALVILQSLFLVYFVN